MDCYYPEGDIAKTFRRQSARRGGPGPSGPKCMGWEHQFYWDVETEHVARNKSHSLVVCYLLWFLWRFGAFRPVKQPAVVHHLREVPTAAVRPLELHNDRCSKHKLVWVCRNSFFHITYFVPHSNAAASAWMALMGKVDGTETMEGMEGTACRLVNSYTYRTECAQSSSRRNDTLLENK